MDALLFTHVALTWAMVGFAWTIQLVQYPMMALVPPEAFPAFERVHQRRVVRVLAVFGVAEVVTAGWLFLVPGTLPRAALLVAGMVLAVIWIATGTYFAPLHGRLARGFDVALHKRLVVTNWIRTVLWTLRGVMVVALLVAR